MIPNYTIPAGFSEVTNLDDLQTSGSRSARLFFPGDTIVLTSDILSKPRIDRATGEPVPDKTTGKTLQVYYIIGSINGGSPTPIPFASFRRFPRAVNEFLKDAPLMRQLYSGSDRDRFELLKGKTLSVSRLVDGEAIDFSKPQNADGSYVFKSAQFPVFELVEQA